MAKRKASESIEETSAHSDEGSESEDLPELLVHGRDRRVTAGNKYNSLITGQTKLEEDEIFQEAEDDEEFESSDSEDESGMEDSEDEAAEKRDEYVQEGEGENAGEAEIARQQREEKRAKKKKVNALILGQPKVSTAKRKKRKTMSNEEATRRSSRAHAIETAEELRAKKEVEEQRKKTRKVVQRVKVRELTQEEKLSETVITEEENKRSLAQFFEQEAVRKTRQERQSQRKQIHGPLIRFLSTRKNRQSSMAPSQEFVTLENFPSDDFDAILTPQSAPIPSKLSLCCITGQPAKYFDPYTQTAYYNAAAFKELRKVYAGDYDLALSRILVEKSNS